MSDRFVTLLGTNDVRSAANRMVEAALAMQSAASGIEDSLNRQRQFMDDWLVRLGDVINPDRKEEE